ncbi:hypothetical protein T492DRAFT_895174, partial [Pavlovales sp. CCMP2436]
MPLTRMAAAASLFGRRALGPPRAWAAVTSSAVCDQAVDVYSSPTRTIYLVGTAHVSEDSALLVRDLIRQ